eukprot:TRINITY_DN11616_c0_g1_i3.p1 TRINITY_DN11616_c0_g1~~TRINITY_DN11616_c0_g1_i3.p1  ORF type:complete len:225 (-),score=54.78 TRINITY_DN11616_c0_g1_i3:642-1235(-)
MNHKQLRKAFSGKVSPEDSKKNKTNENDNDRLGNHNSEHDGNPNTTCHLDRDIVHDVKCQDNHNNTCHHNNNDDSNNSNNNNGSDLVQNYNHANSNNTSGEEKKNPRLKKIKYSSAPETPTYTGSGGGSSSSGVGGYEHGPSSSTSNYHQKEIKKEKTETEDETGRGLEDGTGLSSVTRTVSKLFSYKKWKGDTRKG